MAKRVISILLLLAFTAGIWHHVDVSAKRTDFAIKVNSEEQTEIAYGEYENKDEYDRRLEAEFNSKSSDLTELVSEAGLLEDSEFVNSAKQLFTVQSCTHF